MISRRDFLKFFAAVPVLFAVDKETLVWSPKETIAPTGQKLLKPTWDIPLPLFTVPSGLIVGPPMAEWRFPMTEGDWHFGMFSGAPPQRRDATGMLLAYSVIRFVECYGGVMLKEPQGFLALENGRATYFRLIQLAPECRGIQGNVGEHLFMVSNTIIQESTVTLDAMRFTNGGI